MAKTVCFTGHRTIPQEQYPNLVDALNTEIERQIRAGAVTFRTGGALGFDTLAALCVLSARKQHPHIRLELILPCPTQSDNWNASDTRLYEQIIEQADCHRYVSQYYYAGVLQMRNRALVEGSDVCIAYLRTSHGGGTAYTAACALRAGVEFVNLFELLK
ncbi:MAG: DUF1273 family protein [Clostridia bacterium]|nr:DUF1273 family protein [Clostridia bacterium]